MMQRLSLGDLLSFFPSNDLAQALARAGLHGGGAKIERIELLRSAAVRGRASAQGVLSHFTAESLRRLATRFGIRGSTKDEYVAGLAAALTEPFPPPRRAIATTVDSIRDYVRTLSGSHRSITSEADAEWFIASALADHLDDVRTQAPVPGQFGHRIDIDIQNGRFGVEVKLATAIIESSSEAYRLLGQAFYYDRRRFAGRLLVVIVGPDGLQKDPTIVEIISLLGALGIAGVYLCVNGSR